MSVWKIGKCISKQIPAAVHTAGPGSNFASSESPCSRPVPDRAVRRHTLAPRLPSGPRAAPGAGCLIFVSSKMGAVVSPLIRQLETRRRLGDEQARRFDDYIIYIAGLMNIYKPSLMKIRLTTTLATRRVWAMNRRVVLLDEYNANLMNICALMACIA